MSYKYIVAKNAIISVNADNCVVEHLEKIPLYIESMKYQDEYLVISAFYQSNTYQDIVKCFMVVDKEIVEPEMEFHGDKVIFCFQMIVPEQKIPDIKFFLEYKNQKVELKKRMTKKNGIKLNKKIVRVIKQKFMLLSPKENINYMVKALMSKVKNV